MTSPDTKRPGMTGPVAVLVGPMGAGKSTVGRALAADLGVDFCDTDHEIERRAGRTIPEIFAGDGEATFRTMEADVVTDVLSRFRGVVALGGGAVMTAAVREALAGHPVIYLEIGPDAGFSRVESSSRPLLDHPDPAGRYAALLASRTQTYRSVATIVVDGERAADIVVGDIGDRLGSVTRLEGEIRHE